MKWLDELWDLVFPPLCACCDKPLQSGEVVLCTGCRVGMPLTFYWQHRGNYVEDLFAGRFIFAQASSLMFFKQGSRYQRLIHRLKYSSRRDVAYLLGEIYGQFLSSQPHYSTIDFIVPVPLHWSRFIKRGYNQSEFFAEGIAFSMGISVSNDVLRRKYRTHTQARMKGVEQRAENVAGAFVAKNVEKIAGKQILIVDDVITSGSTIEASALAVAVASPTTVINVGSMAVVQSTKYNKSYVDESELVGVEPTDAAADVNR